MNVQPLFDRVLVERDENSDQKSPGGLIIPDTAKTKAQKATVIAIGPGVINQDGVLLKTQLKPKDRVLIPDYNGSEITINSIEYVIIKEKDILGMIENE